MKKYMTFIIAGAFCCLFALVAGCSSSRLVDIWSDSSFQPPSLKKILVVSVSRNPTLRRIWEDAFIAELAKHNVTSSPSYRLFPDAVPDTNQVLQTVRSDGYDGVLITRRLPTETNTEYVPGYVTKEQTMSYDRRRERFVTYYYNIEHAGHVDSQKVHIRAIDVWDTKNGGQMIWSATSETPEPSSVQEVRPEIVQLVMVELTKRGIIAPEP